MTPHRAAWLPRQARDVVLRRLSPADLDAFVAYRADPELGRHPGWQPMDREAARAFLREMAAAEPWAAGAWFQLGIARRADDRLIGDIGVRVQGDGCAEIGFTLAREAQGRGWGVQAVGEALAMLFEGVGIERVVAVADERHAASVRLLERLGFAGNGRQAAVCRGEPCVERSFERPRDARRARARAFIAASADGFIAREDGALDWLERAHTGAPAGEDFGYADFVAGVDALVMGRRSFDTVRGFEPWPYAALPVIVLSRGGVDLPPVLQASVTTSAESPAALLWRLGREGPRSVYVDGGMLLQSFLRDGLIDELTLTTIPVLLGRGRPLFGPLPADVRLELLGQRRWEHGVVQHRWRVDAAQG